DERLRRQLAAVGEGLKRHLHGVVDDPARPLLTRGELLEDVEPPCLGGRVRLPAAPRPVILIEVAATAFLEGVVAAARPGEGVAELGHGPFYSRPRDVAGPAPARPSTTASGGLWTPRADERRVGWSPLRRGVGVARRPASSLTPPGRAAS